MISLDDVKALMPTVDSMNSAMAQHYINYVNNCIQNRIVVFGPMPHIADNPDVVAAVQQAKGLQLYWKNYKPFIYTPAIKRDNAYYKSNDKDGYAMYMPTPANSSETDKLHIAGPVDQTHGWKNVLNSRQNIPQQRVELKNPDRHTT